jgi:hypothetical protein
MHWKPSGFGTFLNPSSNYSDAVPRRYTLVIQSGVIQPGVTSGKLGPYRITRSRIIFAVPVEKQAMHLAGRDLCSVIILSVGIAACVFGLLGEWVVATR